MIYLDNAATTCLDESVFHKMKEYELYKYGNAYSLHRFGVETRNAVEEAREIIAKYFNCSECEIYFTSGATESNNWVIYNAIQSSMEKIHIITTKIEHDSVLNACKYASQWCEVTYLNVDNQGVVDVIQLEDVLKKSDAGFKLVSVMTANNEVGTIQPIKKIGKLCKKYGAYFHTDATQAVSTMQIDVEENNIDFLSCSAHKFYGPKGIGILYIREGIPMKPLLFGGEQERNLRAGTTNAPAIIGMGEAIRLLAEDNHNNDIEFLRDMFISTVLYRIKDCRVNGPVTDRISGNANICFGGINGAESLLMMLEVDGIMVSSGSACNSSSLDPSHVLKAMGMTDEDAKNSVRFSFGKNNTIADVYCVIDALEKDLEILRK